MIRVVLAIVLPCVAMLLAGRLFAAILCLILQVTIIGWPIASLWAWVVTATGGAGKHVINYQGSFRGDVVGESFYVENIEAVVGRRRGDGVDVVVEATIELEDDNPTDENAVVVKLRGRVCGHLARDGAITFRKRLTQAGIRRRSWVVPARVRGGWNRGGSDKGEFSIRVAIDEVFK
jgi:hypothetical protein